MEPIAATEPTTHRPAPGGLSAGTDLTGLRERLLARAFLFDDPVVYQAGVEDALVEVASVLAGSAAARHVTERSTGAPAHTEAGKRYIDWELEDPAG